MPFRWNSRKWRNWVYKTEWYQFGLFDDLELMSLAKRMFEIGSISDIRQSIDRNDFGENPSFWN